MNNIQFKFDYSSIKLKAGDQDLARLDLLEARVLLTQLEHGIEQLKRREECEHERSLRYEREGKA